MDANDGALGLRIRSFGLVLKGQLAETRWLQFLSEVVLAIGMNPVGDTVVRTYPVDGKGGVGLTIFQAITESFLVMDIWPDHDGAYLFVCSCRPFYSTDIDSVAALFGLETSRADDKMFRAELNLK